MAAKAAWEHPETFATTLLTLFVDAYGIEPKDGETSPLEWDPATIALEVQDDFDVTLPRANYDRLMAAISILTSDAFYQSTPDFIELCNILSGDVLDPRTWDPADAAECAWGITEALLISPPEDDDENPFSPEITAYLGAMLDAEGIITPPDVLQIATGRDPLLSSRIKSDYTDDPEMFAAIYGFEADKTSGIDAAVRENLRKLAGQLDALSLRVGDARGAVRNLFTALSKRERTDSVI